MIMQNLKKMYYLDLRLILVIVLGVSLLSPALIANPNDNQSESQNNVKLHYSNDGIPSHGTYSQVSIMGNVTPNVLCDIPCDGPW